LKPGNLMVRPDGLLKVLDFGLARLLPTSAVATLAAAGQATAPGTLLGTVLYMSPEQARGEPVGAPSDLFSLGIVFYELAAGRHPFPADSPVSVLYAIATQEPLPAAQLNPELPAAL